MYQKTSRLKSIIRMLCYDIVDFIVSCCRFFIDLIISYCLIIDIKLFQGIQGIEFKQTYVVLD